MNKSLNIVFWGEDAFSNVILTSLIKAGHQVSLVVTPYYENFVYKRLELTCNKNNIPLLRAKNCFITPHIAWAPKESRKRLMDIAVDNLAKFAEGKPVNVVNP